MIDRRLFIGTVTLGVLTPSLAAQAQQAGKVWRIGYLQGSSREAQTHLIQAFEDGLREKGYTLGRNPVIEYRFADGRLAVVFRGADDLGEAFTGIRSARADAVIVSGGPVVLEHRAKIAELALRNRLPTIGANPQHARSGFLMSYGPSTTEQWRRAAGYVDRILKGAKPGDLPVEQPITFELVINLKTAKALGLTIAPSLLQRADEVIQ